MHTNCRRLLLVTILVNIALFALPNSCHAASTNLYALVVNGGCNRTAAVYAQKSAEKICEKNKIGTLVVGKHLVYSSEIRNRSISRNDFINGISVTFKKASANDVGMFFYVGHGSKSGFYYSPDGIVSYKDVAKQLAKSRCKKIICVIDACHSEGFIKNGVKVLSSNDQKRFIVFTACRYNQTAAFNSRGNSRFLNTVAAALGCSDQVVYADLNNDRKVTVSELNNYLKTVIPTQVIDYDWSKDQDPVTFAFNFNDDLFRYNYYGIKINKPYLLLYEFGRSQNLHATVTGSNSKVVWTSSNSGVAYVAQDGTVVPGKAGVAYIYAKVGSVSASCKVEVIDAWEIIIE